jgi:type I restriction enzyme S subunit
MDAQQFLAEFGHIANAPGGVIKLRELVLQLAIQGRLISPLATIESSNGLLAEIRAIKAKLVFDKKLSREKPFPEISKSEIDVNSPPHWEWIRFGEIWQLLSGRDLEPSQYNDSKNGIPYITGASNIENGVININRWTESPLVVSTVGDLLITCKGTIGKTAFNNFGEVHIARQIMAIRNFSGKLNTGFLKIWLDGFISHLVSKSKSMIPGFSRDDLILAIYPVPPLEEQARIVAKVDELIALCDRLEQQQQQRRKLQNALRQSILQAVATATSPHELQSSWNRLANHFGQLFSAPEDVRQLRDVTFDLALRGLFLTESLLNNQVEISNDDRPTLPSGWEWKDLTALSEYITSGSRGWKLYIANNGDAFIRSQDIRQDSLIFDNPAYVLLPEKAEGKRTLVRPSDLLLTITGGNVGKCAVVSELPYKAYVSQHVALIRLKDPSLAEFIHYWMINAYGGRGFLSRYIYGDKPGLNLTQVGSVPIPVPPMASLSQIIISLRTHQQICDRLAEQLRIKNTLAGALALAAVSTFTGITTEPDEEPMKAPSTELIAPIRLGETPDIKAQAPLATLLTRHNGEMSAKDLWQRFGGEIDAFYAQLKTEVAHGWIQEPEQAEMRSLELN